ncbi:MAG: pantoate--beta-alanine ligase [Bacteroidia bacterium]
MIVIKSPFELDILLNRLRGSKKKIGFVATMGALHNGHISLIERSKSENDTTVCSIFVNPKQFNDVEDLEKYPRPIEADIKLLTESKTDILFLPSIQDIYPINYIELLINLNGFDNNLEGKLRPGHFQGVAQVVKQLFNFVKPDKAYFGQKDYQQTLVIKQIVKQFKLPLEIVICAILREENGLAMSSRNIRLTIEQRNKAEFIYKTLLDLKENIKIMSYNEAIEKGKESILKNEGAIVEYLTIVDAETLLPIESIKDIECAIAWVVVNYFGVRLLDNIYL